MKTLVLLAGLALAASLADAQPAPGPPSASEPTGLVVGSGNFYSPIVANLEEAVRFYRDGIGFQFEGEPGNADANPQLRQMFGLPDARLRWQIGRAPGIQGGVEIVEISSAGGVPLELRMQDPGAVMLIVWVRDVDATLARLEALRAPVVTRGGAPVTVGAQSSRAVVVKDPAGHFVELVQSPTPPAVSSENVVAVRVRHVVEDLERATALYRDALGLQGTNELPADYYNLRPVTELLAVPENTRWRFIHLIVPTSGLEFELMEFMGARRPQSFEIASPGATRIQLRVADVDAAAAALVRAGGTFVSTGGKPLDLPAGNRTLKVGVVRDPDGLFVVLIDTPPAQ